MGLALTEGEIRFAQVAAIPQAAFLTTVNTMVLECGWVRLGDYLNGSEYKLISPQSLTCRCRIWFPTDTVYSTHPHFAMQFLSDATPAATGHVHHFLAGWAAEFTGDSRVFTHYEVWCNKVSIFIGAVHPQSRNNQPKAVQGGVPWATGITAPTPACSGQTPEPISGTDELWFSAGDDAGVYSESTPAPSCVWNFRNQHVAMRYSLMHNGTLSNISIPLAGMTMEKEEGALQLGILKTSYMWSQLTQQFPDGFIYRDRSPLAVVPFVIHKGYLLGQLYDAALVSRPYALDEVETIIESEPAPGRTTVWQNYMRADQPGVSVSTFVLRNEGETHGLLLLQSTTGMTPIDLEANVAF
jgi:hypothetical protein